MQSATISTKELYDERLKIKGRAAEKVDDLKDGKSANLRAARDVLWNGAFSESEFCVGCGKTAPPA